MSEKIRDIVKKAAQIPEEWKKWKKEKTEKAPEDDPMHIKMRERDLLDKVKARKTIKSPREFMNWLAKIQRYINEKTENQYKSINEEMAYLADRRIRPGEEINFEDIRDKVISLIEKLPMIGDNLLFSMFSNLFTEDYKAIEGLMPAPARRASIAEMIRKLAKIICQSSDAK